MGHYVHSCDVFTVLCDGSGLRVQHDEIFDTVGQKGPSKIWFPRHSSSRQYHRRPDNSDGVSGGHEDCARVR